ncbi:hypothetical protein HAX54_053115 [Datura stramonium]|uniref:ZF-HD dimerization-type domain-containing protein n=1 Tax=Datura stramonium TaxID=4076 RepID=A0ABS8WRC3_DATST|nr:hypothetical protein [Datura stramonium]
MIVAPFNSILDSHGFNLIVAMMRTWMEKTIIKFPVSFLITTPMPDLASIFINTRIPLLTTSMGHVLDGCGEFCPSGPPETPESFICVACHCHRSFHRKMKVKVEVEVEVEAELELPYSPY